MTNGKSNFLLVLRESELTWGKLIGKHISEEGGNFTIESDINRAVDLIEKPEISFQEIITGSFAESYHQLQNGGWTHILEAAKKRGMGITLLTGYPIGDEQSFYEKLGVKVLEKDNYNRDLFISERFPQKSRREGR